jgi:hypothetical protein
LGKHRIDVVKNVLMYIAFFGQNVSLIHSPVNTVFQKNILFRGAKECRKRSRSVQLLEADVLGVLPEALPAHLQAVLPDEAVAVGAGAASPRALVVLSGPGVPGDVFETHFDENRDFLWSQQSRKSLMYIACVIYKEK